MSKLKKATNDYLYGEPPKKCCIDCECFCLIEKSLEGFCYKKKSIVYFGSYCDEFLDYRGFENE